MLPLGGSCSGKEADDWDRAVARADRGQAGGDGRRALPRGTRIGEAIRGDCLGDER